MNSPPWIITEGERSQNDAQFGMLNPVDGFISGDQAKPLFMKSGLSPTVLAQIWQLADYNKDGKMDRIEFSIAMHLIRTALAGVPIPSVLPDSLKPTSLIMQSPLLTSEVRANAIPGGVPMFGGNIHHLMGQPVETAPIIGSGKIQNDWSIAHHNKLRYCQQFNQLDKGRIGSLAGIHARNVLAQSQLPNVTLAEIWTLSDVNKDGRLSVEEFCIAMHLIDSVKAGFLLPKSLPPELMPSVLRTKSESPAAEPGTPPAQKSVTPKTFEDKRKDNYDRGQAELDRRRQLLREQEERRRAELEKKEKEEAERREREREETERKRQAEREAEMQREREREMMRLAEERRINTEKEEARKEMERQRKAELDTIRIREANSQRQNEISSTTQRKQKSKTLSFQLQALNEKSEELNSSITQTRVRISSITNEIEAMKADRDQKMSEIRNLEAQGQQLSVRCERLAHENLQGRVEYTAGRTHELEEAHAKAAILRQQISLLNAEIGNAAERAQLQHQITSKKAAELEECQSNFNQALPAYIQVCEMMRAAQLKARQVLATRQAEQGISLSAEAEHQPEIKASKVAPNEAEIVDQSSQNANVSLPRANTAAPGAVKYRALYEFNARTDDELSFQPGDIILVFEGHAAEPGWLAGQMRDKVGWFPLAFAEPVVAASVLASQPPQTVSSVTTSPSSEPLQSIIEEPSVTVCKSPSQDASLDRVNGNTNRHVENTEEGSVCTATAQYQWKARNENELSFSKGDQIEIIEQLEMRWKGRSKTGAVGWFPKSYVKLNKSSVEQSEESSDLPNGDKLAPKISEESTSFPSQNASLKGQNLPIYDTVCADQEGSNKGNWYVALYDFHASEANDLDLKAGDRIFVTETVDDWWRGTCDGRTGIFPANYVQKCPEPEVTPQKEEGIIGVGRAVAAFEATADNQLTLHVGDTVKVRSKSPAGWWQGELISGSNARKVGWFPGNYVELLCEGELLAEALYDYAAQRTDELSFNKGDIIVVTERRDDEWWKGRLQRSAKGSEALFPVNYVRVR